MAVALAQESGFQAGELAEVKCTARRSGTVSSVTTGVLLPPLPDGPVNDHAGVPSGQGQAGVTTARSRRVSPTAAQSTPLTGPQVPPDAPLERIAMLPDLIQRHGRY